MYRSANYVLFVNYEDFQAQLKNLAETCIASEPAYFFSGYDADSLALENLTGFAQSFVPFLADVPNCFLELRTKSVNIRSLLKMNATKNCIVTFSMTPLRLLKA